MVNQELFYGRWEQLQEPSRSPIEQSHLLRLLSALDVGWTIEQPVFRRRRWGESGASLFHFILIKAESGRRKLLTLPATLELDQFLQKEEIPVQ